MKTPLLILFNSVWDLKAAETLPFSRIPCSALGLSFPICEVEVLSSSLTYGLCNSVLYWRVWPPVLPGKGQPADCCRGQCGLSPPTEMESATDGSDTNACVCPRSGLLTGAAFNLLPSCAVSSSRVSLLSAWGRERLVFHTAVGCAHG